MRHLFKKKNNMMKKLVGIIVLFVSLSGYAQLPDLGIKTLDQDWTSLEELKGEKLTVVDFWASWCKPCVSAIPKLNELYSEFKDQGVQFIGVNVDGPRNQAKVKPLVSSLNVRYPVVLDPDQELSSMMNVSALPTLIVFNAKGKEVFVHEGFAPGDEKLLKEKLQKLQAQ